jgi:hypothetical protein
MRVRSVFASSRVDASEYSRAWLSRAAIASRRSRWLPSWKSE